MPTSVRKDIGSGLKLSRRWSGGQSWTWLRLNIFRGLAFCDFYTLQLDCRWPADGVTRLTVGCSVSVRKGSTVQTLRDCSGLRSILWPPRTRAAWWRCQQMVLGNTQSSPGVAEAGEKVVPCKWLLLRSASYEPLIKTHPENRKAGFISHWIFLWRHIYIFNFMAVRIKTLLQPR